MSIIEKQYPYAINNRLLRGCRQILEASHVKEDTNVTIFTHTSYPQQHIVNSYYQAALDLGATSTIIMNESYKIPMYRGPGSINVPKATEAALLASDFLITMGINVFGTPFVQKIRDAKIPLFFGYNSLFSTEWLIMKYPPPNQAVIKRTDAGVDLLKKCNEVRYETPAGTNLTMGIHGGSREVGFIEPDKGHIFDILAGAGFYGHFEPESCNGTYVVVAGDYPSQIVDREHGFPYWGDKITFTIKDSKITKIEGGTGAKFMRQWFESFNDERIYILNHMGVGTDPRQRRDFERFPYYGVSGWDGEWMDGLICLGIANGPTHLDIMQRNGSVWIDDDKILEDEKYVGLLTDKELGITEEDKKGPATWFSR